MALMLLTARWCKRRGLPPPQAFTVDHGLRKDSDREAQKVSHWAHIRGVPHQALVWIGHKPAENIQARAREARYRLLGERMQALGLKTLLTGHTRDDQAETFLLRLARGSGLDGLSGMAPVAPFPLAGFAELHIARPLLAFSHKQLMGTLTQLDQPWIDDPSNADDRFARVQIRNAMTALENAGLTGERIAGATTHLRRAREAIEASVAQLIAAAVELSPWGYALVAADTFAAAPREVSLRALAKLIEVVGGGEYPPRFEQTEAALEWLTAHTGPKGRTLGGCRLARREQRTILIAREEAALAKEDPIEQLEPGTRRIWDRRFEIALSQKAKAPLEVRRLGPSGLKSAGKLAALPPIEPRRIAAALPAVWREGALIATPLLAVDHAKAQVSARFLGLAR
ncbi:MAG: tRNA lysidine(34) synthetase TilS [Alphaproteobacteria bacterium]|nr:tRNA lysidine(34) synthetase TilS [Alphaproteobacteria bacterium]